MAQHSALTIRNIQYSSLCIQLPNADPHPNGEGSGEDRHVVDLLVEQIEAADTLVLNKSDQMKPKQMERLQVGCLCAVQCGTFRHSQHFMYDPLPD